MKTLSILLNITTLNLLLLSSCFSQTNVTPANAYNQTSNFTPNPTEANGTFNFDYKVTGKVVYDEKSYNYDYFLNSRDGSIGISDRNIARNLGDRSQGDEKFVFMVMHTTGSNSMYFLNEEDNTKKVYSVRTNYGALTRPSEENGVHNPGQVGLISAGQFESFRLNAIKTNTDNHPVFGPQKIHTGVYEGLSNSTTIKMTIANRGVGIAISPFFTGFLVGIFKDEIQNINRVITSLEIGDKLKVNINRISPELNSKHLTGYEAVETNIDPIKMSNNSALLTQLSQKAKEKNDVYLQLYQELIGCGESEACAQRVARKIERVGRELEEIGEQIQSLIN